MADIEIEEATGEDTQTKLIASRDHSRDEKQVWVDKKVADLVKRYHEAGDPAPSETAPFLRLAVKKDDRPDLRRMVNRAFTLISSGDNPDLVPAFYLDGKGDDGKVTMKFNVQPAPTKAEKGKEDPNAAAADPNAAAAAADSEGTQEGTQDREGTQEEAPNPGRLAGLRGRR